MLKFECECKSESRDFFVNKKTGMVQCIDCRQRYKFEDGAWVKFQSEKVLMNQLGKIMRKMWELCFFLFFNNPVAFHPLSGCFNSFIKKFH